MSKRTVYHYTDKKGKEAIENSGQINPSSDGAFGPGTYLTSKPPTEGRKAVSENNWDGGWQNRESRGRADHVIELKIPENKLREPPNTGNRDILIHDGPIKLDDYDCKAMQK